MAAVRSGRCSDGVRSYRSFRQDNYEEEELVIELFIYKEGCLQLVWVSASRKIAEVDFVDGS